MSVFGDVLLYLYILNYYTLFKYKLSNLYTVCNVYYFKNECAVMLAALTRLKFTRGRASYTVREEGFFWLCMRL